MKSLRDRFREFRRTKPAINKADVPVEFSFKGKKEKGKYPPKKQRLEVPVGEDVTSFERHLKLLQLEHKKVKNA